jgi:hypothetical protein
MCVVTIIYPHWHLSAAKAADPAVTFTSVKVLGLSGEATILSNAAGLPNQQVEYMYAVGHAPCLNMSTNTCRLACKTEDIYIT